jgi:hypothetical protein
MSMPKKFAAVLLLLMAAACEATYYKVIDPATGREYYTLDYTNKGAVVEFKDAKTGAKTTLQNPQVLEINEQMFDAGVAAPAR